MIGLKYTVKQKQSALKMWLTEGRPLFYVCNKFRCSERSLWYWKSKYNGNLASLENVSSRPKSPHPNAHTVRETAAITAIIAREPNIGYHELYGELRRNCGYNRSFSGMYRYIKKHVATAQRHLQRRENKPYDTPPRPSDKWQMDVKYVPLECSAKRKRYYQYTVIDEATRERYLYAYEECNSTNTVDFTLRAIKYFGYLPKIIQTDNGTEFVSSKSRSKTPKTSPLDRLCERLGVLHRKIRPYTPRHNGKVERSHRGDSERFYRSLKFENLADLRRKMSAYLARSNNIPMSPLGLLSPLQTREKLFKFYPKEDFHFVDQIFENFFEIYHIFTAIGIDI